LTPETLPESGGNLLKVAYLVTMKTAFEGSIMPGVDTLDITDDEEALNEAAGNASLPAHAASDRLGDVMATAKQKQNVEFDLPKQATPSSAPAPAPHSDRKEKLETIFRSIENVPNNSPEYVAARQELDKLIFG
jgi:hypothetical protein